MDLHSASVRCGGEAAGVGQAAAAGGHAMSDALEAALNRAQGHSTELDERPERPQRPERGSLSLRGSAAAELSPIRESPRSAHAGALRVQHWHVQETSIVRAGPEKASPKVGHHQKGTVIDVVEEATDAQGLKVVLTTTAPPSAMRGGWMRVLSSKGRTLLQLVEMPIAPGRYRVNSRRIVREGPSKDTAVAEPIVKGSVVSIVDSMTLTEGYAATKTVRALADGLGWFTVAEPKTIELIKAAEPELEPTAELEEDEPRVVPYVPLAAVGEAEAAEPEAAEEDAAEGEGEGEGEPEELAPLQSYGQPAAPPPHRSRRRYSVSADRGALADFLAQNGAAADASTGSENQSVAAEPQADDDQDYDNVVVVTCPEGMKGGDLLYVTCDVTGREVVAQIPDGTNEGDDFDVDVGATAMTAEAWESGAAARKEEQEQEQEEEEEEEKEAAREKERSTAAAAAAAGVQRKGRAEEAQEQADVEPAADVSERSGADGRRASEVAAAEVGSPGGRAVESERVTRWRRDRPAAAAAERPPSQPAAGSPAPAAALSPAQQATAALEEAGGAAAVDNGSGSGGAAAEATAEAGGGGGGVESERVARWKRDRGVVAATAERPKPQPQPQPPAFVPTASFDDDGDDELEAESGAEAEYDAEEVAGESQPLLAGEAERSGGDGDDGVGEAAEAGAEAEAEGISEGVPPPRPRSWWGCCAAAPTAPVPAADIVEAEM